MIRKTYGVSGLMDWTAQIRVGKGTVSVHFTDGALTAYGVTPAKFSTSNPFFQTVIENSDYFRSGRIELLGRTEVPDNAAAKARKERAAKATAQPAQADEAAPKDEPAPKGEPADTERKAPTQVRMTDLNSAKEYLKDNYLSNAAFTGDMNLWRHGMNIRVFTVDARFLMFNRNFYGRKDAFSSIVDDDSMRVLRIKNSYIEQSLDDFNKQPTIQLYDIFETQTRDVTDPVLTTMIQ